MKRWERVLGVNLGGVIHGSQVFAPAMLEARPAGADHQHRLQAGHHHAAGRPGLQRGQGRGEGVHRGAAARAAQHAGCRITAHLLIPGYVHTPLTARGRTEKPAAAWTPEQTVAFMLTSLERGDFYILCPDNDVPRSLDERRILWAAQDIIENRPPLSRWHKDWAERFKAWLANA